MDEDIFAMNSTASPPDRISVVVDATAKDRKRMRDRKAQRNHRKRQKSYVQGLEARIEMLKSLSNSEDSHRLWVENERLRQKIAECHAVISAIESLTKRVTHIESEVTSVTNTMEEPQDDLLCSGHSARSLERTAAPGERLSISEEFNLVPNVPTQPAKPEACLDLQGQPASVTHDKIQDVPPTEGEPYQQGITQSISSEMAYPIDDCLDTYLQSPLDELTELDCLMEMNRSVSFAAYDQPLSFDTHQNLNKAPCDNISLSCIASHMWPTAFPAYEALAAGIHPFITKSIPHPDSGIYLIIHKAKSCSNLQTKVSSGRRILFDLIFDSLKIPMVSDIKQLLASVQRYNEARTFLGICWVIYVQLDWQVTRSPEAYQRLPPFLRPTPAQTLVPHSIMIDFLIWPAWRDQLIVYEKSEPDRLVDIMAALGYFTRLNYQPTDQNDNIEESFVEAICNLKNWTIDQKFFELYPEWESIYKEVTGVLAH